MAVLQTLWHEHPKILRLGLDAMGLHAWSISYCDAQLTDGFVPEEALPSSLPRVKQAVQRLVDGGRWEPVGGGWRVHNYLKYNRPRAEVLAKRERDRRRIASERAASRGNVARDSGASSGRVAPESPASRPRVAEDLPARGEPAYPYPVPESPTATPVYPPKSPLPDANGADGPPARAFAPPGEADPETTLELPDGRIVGLRQGGGVCVFCSLAYTGDYGDHLQTHAKAPAEPGNLGRHFRRFSGEKPPAPSPEEEAQYLAGHARIQEALAHPCCAQAEATLGRLHAETCANFRADAAS